MKSITRLVTGVVAVMFAVAALRSGHFRSFILGTKRLRAAAHRFRACAISAVQNLTQYRPLEHEFPNHLTSRDSRVSAAVENLRCSTAIAGLQVFGVPSYEDQVGGTAGAAVPAGAAWNSFIELKSVLYTPIRAEYLRLATPLE
jgi:hypothetical protein